MATIDAGLDRGRSADTPSEMTFEGWKDILWRVYSEFFADRITLIAAGATFYLLLALFPALAAFVSLYGFVADPVTIADHIAFLGSVLPQAAWILSSAQLQSLASAGQRGAELRLYLRPVVCPVERQQRHQDAVRGAQRRLRRDGEARLHPPEPRSRCSSRSAAS